MFLCILYIVHKNHDGWTATGVTLTSPDDASTSFRMPANAVTFTAAFKDAPKYVGLFGFNTKYISEPWNWVKFIVLFGWVWMWFF